MNAPAWVIFGKQTERQFMAHVVAYAKMRGWRAYHTHDSRRSDPGFPDLVLVRGGRLVFAELKAEKGRVSPVQQEWLEALSAAQRVAEGMSWHDVVSVFVWRPSDWPEIEEVLR